MSCRRLLSLIPAFESLDSTNISNIKTFHILNWKLNIADHKIRPKFLNQAKKSFKKYLFQKYNKKTLYNNKYFNSKKNQNLKLIYYRSQNSKSWYIIYQKI